MWAIDFQNDHLQDGSGFRMASILDEHSRLVLDAVDTSITGEYLVTIPEVLPLKPGMPDILRIDNGTGLTCQAIAERAEGVGLVLILPGEP